jgi:hypothetical protein
MEEVRRQDRLRLGIQEPPPRLPRPPLRGIDACVLQDLPDRRRRQLASQAGQFAMDAPVPQPGLSRAISSTSDRTVGAVFGRPSSSARDQVSGYDKVIGTHSLKLQLDVSFGDPVTPAPRPSNTPST